MKTLGLALASDLLRCETLKFSELEFPREVGLLQFSLFTIITVWKAATNTKSTNMLLLGEIQHQVPARPWSRFCQLTAT